MKRVKVNIVAYEDITGKCFEVPLTDDMWIQVGWPMGDIDKTSAEYWEQEDVIPFGLRRSEYTIARFLYEESTA